MRALWLTGVLWGCVGSSTPDAGVCPSVADIEALHAAAFFLERSDTDAAELVLKPVRRTSERKAAELERRLEVAVAHLKLKPEIAREQVERVRLELGEWSCMSEALHERFHRALPPISP